MLTGPPPEGKHTLYLSCVNLSTRNLDGRLGSCILRSNASLAWSLNGGTGETPVEPLSAGAGTPVAGGVDIVWDSLGLCVGCRR